MNEHLLLVINGWAGRNQLLDNVMIFCARYLIFAVFALAVSWFVYALYRHNWRQAGFFTLNLIITFMLLQIASHLYVDHRPFVDHHLTQLVAHAAGKSFPSDHTTAASAIALAFLLLTKFKKLGVVLLFTALVIGFARIFTGLHYPVDIYGALLTAIIGMGVTYPLYLLLANKRQMQQESHGKSRAN